MYPVSDAFLRKIVQSGRRKTAVDVYYDGQKVASGLPVSGGTIRADLDSDIRRTGSITIADPSMVPTFDSGILSPLGTEILVQQGVVFADGSEELVPLGMFRLETTDWSDAEGSIPTIQVYDRSKALQVDLPPTVSYSGWLAKDAIMDLLQFIYPQLGLTSGGVFGISVPNYRLPGGHTLTGTYASAIAELSANLGSRFFFDAIGQARVEVIPDVSPDADPEPVITLGVGEGGVLVDADHSYSREGVYNSITVVGAAMTNGTIPSATIRNTASSSPIRWDGPFGRVPKVIEDNTLTTGSQCAQRATVELRKYMGAAYSIDFSSVPNPALQEGDVVRFDFLDGSSELHELATLSIPLGTGSFTGSSKAAW
ncbi:DUF5047 domain-containing protein [Plantactinospora solaniradicis]|uniref:DUF5047 domain-containing protein n=1 Tax=Plantactinospora solaniradicis TaxID=1723736 RepID=A0ABW1KJ75_9ACTN